MNNPGDRLRLCEAILTLIQEHRLEAGDPMLGADIERTVLDAQFTQIETEILANPCALDPWLLRRRAN